MDEKNINNRKICNYSNILAALISVHVFSIKSNVLSARERPYIMSMCQGVACKTVFIDAHYACLHPLVVIEGFFE